MSALTSHPALPPQPGRSNACIPRATARRLRRHRAMGHRGLGDVHRDRSLTATRERMAAAASHPGRPFRCHPRATGCGSSRGCGVVVEPRCAVASMGAAGDLRSAASELRVPLVQRGIGYRPLGSALRAARPRRASGRVRPGRAAEQRRHSRRRRSRWKPQPPAERSALLVPSGSRSKPGTTSTRSERYSVGRDTWNRPSTLRFRCWLARRRVAGWHAASAQQRRSGRGAAPASWRALSTCCRRGHSRPRGTSSISPRPRTCASS